MDDVLGKFFLPNLWCFGIHYSFSSNFFFFFWYHRGGFAIVRKAVSKKTGEACAAKYISKKDIQADELKCLRREIDIMKKIDHQNVLKLYDVYEDDDYVIMIIELYLFVLIQKYVVFKLNCGFFFIHAIF